MKYTVNIDFRTEFEQLITVTTDDKFGSGKALVIESDKEKQRLYFANDQEIDTLIEMLKKIKD